MSTIKELELKIKVLELEIEKLKLELEKSSMYTYPYPPYKIGDYPYTIYCGGTNSIIGTSES